jgi:hypothetical protein
VLTVGRQSRPSKPSNPPEVVPPRIQQRDMLDEVAKPKRWYSFFE